MARSRKNNASDPKKKAKDVGVPSYADNSKVPFPEFVADIQTPDAPARPESSKTQKSVGDVNLEASVDPPTKEAGVPGDLGKNQAPNAQEPGKKAFVQLFANNRKLDMGMKLKLTKEEGNSIVFKEEDILDVTEKLGFCLVGYFTQRHPGREALNKISNSWGVNFEIVPDVHGWIIFKFKSEADRNIVLQGGPYLVYGRSLILEVLPQGWFRFGVDDVKHVPVWVTLPQLPLDLYSEKAISRIASCIGLPMVIDKLTLTMERVSYARFMVKVDVSKELVRTLNLTLRGKEFVQNIIYENEPKYCNECKHIGHSSLNCNRGKEIPEKVAAKAGQVGKKRTTNPANAPIVAAKETGDEQVVAVKQLGDASIVSKPMDKGKGKVRTLKGRHESRVSSLDWNDRTLTTGGMDGLIVNNDVRTRSHVVSTYRGHNDEVCGLKWCPSGRQLASGGNDSLVHIWSASKAGSSWLHRFDRHSSAVKALSWSPLQNNLLASGGGTNDKCIKFWNTSSGLCLSSVNTGSQVCALLWSPHEREILSAHGPSRNELALWRYPSMVKIAELHGHTSRVLSMAKSPDGDRVGSITGDETMRVWNVFGKSLRKERTELFHDVPRIR